MNAPNPGSPPGSAHEYILRRKQLCECSQLMQAPQLASAATQKDSDDSTDLRLLVCVVQGLPAGDEGQVEALRQEEQEMYLRIHTLLRIVLRVKVACLHAGLFQHLVVWMPSLAPWSAYAQRA